MLEPFDEARFQMIALGIMGLYALLAAGAVLRQEPRTPTLAATAQRATQLSFFEAVRRIIWVDPQARRFFVMVMLSVTGSLAQDVLLEPYGALVLGMSVAQTTRLTALWGIGTALAMMAAGVTLIARFGYMPVLRAGLLLNVIVFAGIITAGALGSTTLFQGIVFLLGVGTGLATAGLLTAVIEFTTFVRAGLLMGVWGMAHQIGQAMGGLLGGVMVDVVRRLTDGADLIAYGAVFVTEAAMLLTALELSRRLRVDRATAQSESVPFGNESPFGTSHSGADSISRG